MKLLTYIMLTAMLIFSVSCSSTAELEESGYTPPTVKYQPRLIYPTEAQENTWEGKPIILLDISAKGAVIGAQVIKSSGYLVLDDAAVEYCKNIVFNPALNNDKPLHSRLKLAVDFHFYDYKFSPRKYVREVNTLYKQMHIVSTNLRKVYEDNIFKKHCEFVANVKDALNYNYYMSMVLEDNLVNSWDTLWNSWPLSFLVFHDFLNRYPDYADSASVKSKLYSALKEDVNYIIKTPSSFGDRRALLSKIESFMKREYPELDIDDINFDENKIEQPNI